eukprot:CAMPEP_0205824232 /NCGR_PEP_ID=MMETSP0206-20130828/20118_1 /ASSEMBLY_ACC=CAM_ASM_000279 /TAXON_ID=36767 /ORGANISM="Euplotes focardii, Strain TN1" /LENGTH=146 /DNA_ID=CAMNT_0053122167 /DNA_START=78 /DNA_END=518 /DNA_ORIENTATION=+
MRLRPVAVAARGFADGSHDDFAPIHKPVGKEDLSELFNKDISAHKAFLYMKGDPTQPQCGFSNQVCRILDHLGADYGSRNILENNDVREGIKTFSDWPTVPQLYVDGEFIGGCDIVTTMFKEGELELALKEAGALKNEVAESGMEE